MVMKFVFCVLLALLTAGCATKPKYTAEELALIPLVQKTGLPTPTGGFVLAVGGDTITADEITNEPTLKDLAANLPKNSFELFEQQLRPKLEIIIASKVSNILLYREAKKSAGDSIEDALEAAAESEVRKFLLGFDNNYARAEYELKQMGMDWAAFRESRKKMILRQSYIQTKLPEERSVTHREVLNYYNQDVAKKFSTPAKLSFRLIDIQPAKLELADPYLPKAEQAKRLANELFERLQKGEDFAKIAEEYSHGHRSSFGGSWRPVQPDSLAEPYDILATQSQQMQPGQLAGPIETDEHIFIMKLEEKQSAIVVPFDKVQKEIEMTIRFERQTKAINKFNAKLWQQAIISNKREFTAYCLHKLYRQKAEL